MSFEKFLKDKWLFCITQSIMIVFIGTLLSVFKMNLYGIVFLITAMLLLDIVVLLVEYIQKKVYYKKLLDTLQGLDKKRLISEMMERPEFEEGKLWWEVLQLATKSMNDEVSLYRLLQEEHKTYIEAWIHEIKTPIACMELMCENHRNDLTKNMLVETRKIEGFVEQALFYARSTSVEKDYVLREVSLEALVRNAIKKEARQMIEHKVQVQLGNMDYQVLADPKWVEFMLSQILSNSLKYKGENLRLKCEAEDYQAQVILSIEDNGVGIPDKDIGRVFDKGFTGENGRRYAKSTGIGLYLCKKLCKKMHLGIRLESKEGEGTKVFIIFPKDKRIFFES